MTDGREQIRTPALETVLSVALNHLRRDLNVAMPASVEAYDPENQTVDVQPLIQDTFLDDDGTNVVESLPQLPSVPVVFPRAGGFFVTFPIAVGDHVLLIACDRSIDKFATGDGAETDPVDLRSHSLSDVVAIPGFYPFSKSLADVDPENLVLGKEGGATVKVKADNEINATGANIVLESDSGAVVEIDDAGGVTAVPAGSGVVKLGSASASLAVARETDKTVSDSGMSTWITQVTTALGVLAPLFNAVSGTPVVAGGPGTIIPPSSPGDFGVINQGAAKTKAD